MIQQAEMRMRGGPLKSAGPGVAVSAGIAAILVEITALLDRVAAGGEADPIDLCGAGLSAQDRARLLQALGPGEVLITLQADGESTIRETSVQGVWWNEHRDRRGELIAAFVEVAHVPAILPVDSEQLRRGAEWLRANLQTDSESVD